MRLNLQRSYYSNKISDFINEDKNTILGKLSSHHAHALENLQRNAWIKQIDILKNSLTMFADGHIYFEFSIPRMGKRVDNILIINDSIFVLEFKIGEKYYEKHAIDQVVDYSLDLQNFHEGSHHNKIIPLLVATEAPDIENKIIVIDKLFNPLKTNQNGIAKVINQVLSYSKTEDINALNWYTSSYRPTPTIIEASQALYRGHSVSEISRNEAGATNLSATSECINKIIDDSKAENKKSICFLTGVPGAGKTLAGLNIANERRKAHCEENAVFLSGNGPLVDVLREALARDEVKLAKEIGKKTNKKESIKKANAFIQNIHHFRDDNLQTTKAPIEKVVVFDEAQRAWTMEKARSFMKEKNGQEFDKSEPDFLIEVMNRHEQYCTIVCLIGGGQEINTGEAGISEWIMALKNNYNNWNIYYSSLIVNDQNYLSDKALAEWLRINAISKDELHLSTSVRSFRSEKISSFVHSVVDGKSFEAKTIFNEFEKLFPISLTRDLNTAKKWLKQKAKGTERIGLIASSGARRLKPHDIDVKNKINAEEWFLNDSNDVRSSYYLEMVATEFDIQGLEIDYACLAWDIDFYFDDGVWNYRSFKGTKWTNINKEIDKIYLKNAYRVLLTRARQGLIIFIPHGDDEDPTRPKKPYDETYNFLSKCGLKTI